MPPVTPQKPPYRPAQSGSTSGASRPWNGSQGGSSRQQQGNGGGWQKKDPKPHLAAGAEGEKPDPVKFAADVAKWAAEEKIPTERGYINRAIIPAQIYNGDVCDHCRLPKVWELRGRWFCFGCGYSSDLHGLPGSKLEMKPS